ncbi:MAG TPA: contractile injection system protein, VgrG/Pvc8 family [Allosphingosinicella sp.]|nr:contractile injection system protein, VgrG/Pvc8 family [Allosphingosinicella sp.]
MKLEALDRGYDDFYVPTMVVTVGGEDVLRDGLLALESVEVDLKIKSPARFSFTIGSAYDWEESEFVAGENDTRIDLLDLFAFGAAVKVSLGYGEPSKLEPMIEGIITDVGAGFTDSGTPTLTISGYDKLYPLRLNRTSRHWDKSKISDAVAAVAGANGLSASVQSTRITEASVDQTQESDLAFIERMADLTGSIFYMRAGKFYFGPRSSSSPTLEIPWGQGLERFSPSANLANQVSAVEVHGWSAIDAAAIVGKAQRGDETGRDGQRKSGGDWLAAALGGGPTIQISAPVRDQAEADARALAILEGRAHEFVTGEGESIGVPGILPDTRLTLSGLGRVFGKSYYVSEATHRLDQSGYRTRFAVQEPSL